MVLAVAVNTFPLSTWSSCCLFSRHLTFYASPMDVRNTCRRGLSAATTTSSFSQIKAAAADSMEGMGWVRFPRLSGASLGLMTDIAESMERELGPLLNPSHTPSDVRYFKNSEGNAEGSIVTRSGREGSNIDFVLASWLSCNLAVGSLHISTLVAILGCEADAPHLLFEFIQNAPDSLILVFDLLPRKDLVLHPHYLRRYYKDTGLEAIRKAIADAPESEPYVSSSLFIRSLVSPTALLFKIRAREEGGMERVISELLHPAVSKAFCIWLHGLREAAEGCGSEIEVMARRDEEIVKSGVEVDLSTNMAKLFGQPIADRAMEAFKHRGKEVSS